MRVILNIFIPLLIISASPSQCTSNLVEQIQGQWVCTDDRECPDLILFHKNGRYIVWNDCGSHLYRLIPISEKGNWTVKNKAIMLSNREFFPNASNTLKHRGIDSILWLDVKKSSNTELILTFNLEKDTYSESYKKVKLFPKLARTYSGLGSSIEKLDLTSTQVSLLKLSYKTLSAINNTQKPIELTITDQEGHEIWRKALIVTYDVKKEEILLADNSELLNLNELVFKINTGDLTPVGKYKQSYIDLSLRA